MRKLCFLIFLAAAVPAARASAQDGVDAGDLWRKVRHHDESAAAADEVAARKPFFVVAPSIGSKPSTGLNGGIAGNIAFVAGDSSTTRLSYLSGGLKFSEKGQTLSGVKLAVYFPDDRWFLQGDNRLSWTSQNTYALGGASPATDAENLKYDQFRLYETVYRTIGKSLFLGAGVDVNRHTNIRPGTGTATAFDEAGYTRYTEQHGFNLAHQTSSGTTASLMLDTRDNAINARRGWFANVTYRTFFDGFLGGTSTWQEAYVDVRTYRALGNDGRLATGDPESVPMAVPEGKVGSLVDLLGSTNVPTQDGHADDQDSAQAA